MPTVTGMIQSGEIANLVKALAKAQGQFKPIKRESENPFFKSKYADLGTIIEATKDALSANGLAVTQGVSVSEDGRVNVETMLAHEGGGWLKGTLSLKPKADDPQSIGSACTYARRYALGAILGVASEDDDDGNAATQPAPPAVEELQEHWCYKHSVKFLKTGKMRAYGHPIGKTETWCQETEPSLFDYAGAKGVTAQQILEHFQEKTLHALANKQGVTQLSLMKAIDDIAEPEPETRETLKKLTNG